MRLDRKVVINVSLLVVAVAALVVMNAFSPVTTPAVKASADKDCVCHAAGPDPTQYICIHPSSQAVTDNDNGGHLNEDSSHGPQHAPDFLCDDCSECGPVSTPTPSPTPTPTPV